jgi:hypothetical protein
MWLVGKGAQAVIIMLLCLIRLFVSGEAAARSSGLDHFAHFQVRHSRAQALLGRLTEPRKVIRPGADQAVGAAAQVPAWLVAAHGDAAADAVRLQRALAPHLHPCC